MTYRDSWKMEIPGHREIRNLHERLRTDVLGKWERSLPFGDELFDRWEKADFLGFGEGSSVYDSSVIIGDVRVGSNTWIGPFTVLDGSGGLEIGDSCSISAGVQIYSHDTVARALTGGAVDVARSPVWIGSFSYIGPSTVVTKGVSIGQRCVIGAKTLVTKDVPENSIVYGIPGRIVGHVEIEGDSVDLVYDE